MVKSLFEEFGVKVEEGEGGRQVVQRVVEIGTGELQRGEPWERGEGEEGRGVRGEGRKGKGAR